jgi:hypothetical protein
MDESRPQPQDMTQIEVRLAGFGMSPEAAKAYASFLSGERALRPAPPTER